MEAITHKVTLRSKMGMHQSVILIIRASAVRGQVRPGVLDNRIEIEMAMLMLVVGTRRLLRSVELPIYKILTLVSYKNLA